MRHQGTANCSQHWLYVPLKTATRLLSRGNDRRCGSDINQITSGCHRRPNINHVLRRYPVISAAATEVVVTSGMQALIPNRTRHHSIFQFANMTSPESTDHRTLLLRSRWTSFRRSKIAILPNAFARHCRLPHLPPEAVRNCRPCLSPLRSAARHNLL